MRDWATPVDHNRIPLSERICEAAEQVIVIVSAALLLFVILLCITEAQAQERSDSFYRAAQVAYCASVGADLASTWTLPTDYREGNPVLGGSKAQQAAVSAAISAGVLYLASRLNRKWGKRVLLMGAAAHGTAAAYNWTR
jgi:hypothetical protein